MSAKAAGILGGRSPRVLEIESWPNRRRAQRSSFDRNLTAGKGGGREGIRDANHGGVGKLLKEKSDCVRAPVEEDRRNCSAWLESLVDDEGDLGEVEVEEWEIGELGENSRSIATVLSSSFFSSSNSSSDLLDEHCLLGTCGGWGVKPLIA